MVQEAWCEDGSGEGSEHECEDDEREIAALMQTFAARGGVQGVVQAVDRLGLNGMLALWDPAGGN